MLFDYKVLLLPQSCKCLLADGTPVLAQSHVGIDGASCGQNGLMLTGFRAGAGVPFAWRPETEAL